MTRCIALLTLLLVVVTLVAPALAFLPAVACAATAGETSAGLPPVPLPVLWSWVKSWGPLIIYLIDALITALNNGNDPGGSPTPPPPPPPPQSTDPIYDAPTFDRTAPLAWRGGGAYAAAWA